MTPFTTATGGPPTPMLEFRNVPQLLAEDDYLELVATALPGTAVAAGRRFSALALARLCGATSWASAAEALDLVVSRSESIAGRMTTFVTDPQQLWRGIVGLAERLRQRGPVDYRARRHALAGLVMVPTSALAATYRRHGQPLPAHSRLGVCARAGCGRS